MKYTHITKAIAVVMTMIMLLSCVPSSVLPVFAADAQQSTSIFDNVTLGKGTVTNNESYMAHADAFRELYPDVTDAAINAMVDSQLSPYEPYATTNEEHPFLPGGSANIDLSQIFYGAPATQNYPLTKWSANTSVYNIHQHNGQYAFKDLDLIDGFLWNGEARDERLTTKTSGSYEKGSASSVDTKFHTTYNAIGSKNSNEAFAYNRFDAMQGKYGITLDRNVSWVRWQPSFYENYYSSVDAATGTDDLYQSVLYLSDTPYLYFSTEALDTTKMAISLLIGTQVQKETGSADGDTAAEPTSKYEYRWYTITDNAKRPGIGNDTMNYSMIPNVTVSDVVATVTGRTGSWTAGDQQSSSVMAELTGNEADPLALAGATKAETMYVDGSITGCIDFTTILPLIFANNADNISDGHNDGAGRYNIQYKVAQIRVDTKTAEGEEKDSAARINYLYFGPALSTVFTPQNTVGSDRDANSHRYKQTTANAVGNTEAPSTSKPGSSDDRAYTSGWENGEAVSITNTPNDPQKLTVDIYGKGDGQLIEWSAVPSGADILRGNTSTSQRPSKVWKFTDKNGVVQYMEAQLNTQAHSGIDDSYYVMVTIPVHKWINVLGDSRKIALTATLLHEGTQFPTAHLKPTFVLWGNEDGSIGTGHSGRSSGTRYKNEDLIMVFATSGQTYHTDQGQDYVAAQVDRTIGDSLVYNTNGATVESWFDVLNSPYTYDETVKGTNDTCKITSAMVGYTYVTSLRFAMPIGSAIQIQNMKGDNNSAGLNAYSTTGAIVSAYDGGTGEQPNIDVTSTIPEYKLTHNSSNKTFKSELINKTGIKGNITSGSAAYGPMLQGSNYTIYDLLDTEMLNATAENSHDQDNLGKNKQPVYGQVWKTLDGDLPVYHRPFTTDSTKYGYVYSDSQFIVYSTVIFTDNNNEKWGMTGVLTKNGSTEVGWVQLYDGKKAYASNLGGVLYEERKMTKSQYDGWFTPRGMVAVLKNSWVISDFSSVDDKADFRDGTNTNFEYTADFRNQYNSAQSMAFDPAQNVISKAYNGPQMKYANKWTGSGHYSAAKSLQDFYLRSVNGTDMEWGFNRKTNTDVNISMAMARVFDEPIRLKQGETIQNGSYPVLYLDYTSTSTFKIGLTLRVDGVDKLWYVYGGSSGLNYIAPSSNTVVSGEHYGYLSFEDIMTKDYKDASTIEVTGIALYMWNNTSVSSGNVVIRRCEIWQEENQWYDTIISANQQAGGNTSSAMNAFVKDSMNVVNDAFFNVHNESADGSITVSKVGSYDSGTNIGINNNADRQYQYSYSDGTTSTAMDYWQNSVHYQYTRTESYRKNNSNKGWSAYLRVDTTKDGKVDSKDTTYYSHQGYETDAYQFKSSLGHLRVWVPSDTQASLVFESDRSFNTSNYKYLYYSYSMRDMDTGISAEEPDTSRDDGLKPGIAVSIKQTQLGSAKAYSEIMLADGTRTWGYYPEGNAYWNEQGYDNRAFKTSINAAVDLSSFDGIDSVNQFVFYLNNPMGTLGDGGEAEFYINYLYLSNTPPEDLIADKLKEETYQYYYLMDNTGGRYSARFPTLDNPTGQVTGQTVATDRVNPVIIKRGDRLNQGTYFNGQPLQSYVGYASQATYDKQNDGSTGSMKDIMFYSGTGGDDITDYYEYKKTGTKDTKGDINDMKWSYGRWDTGTGESGLNTMYIGQKDDAALAETEGQISGRLVRRYATENYVLLRAGIQPKKYTTYYDANGGEFIYANSPDYIDNLEQVTENNYYITNDYVLDYYQHPAARPAMKGYKDYTQCMRKPGFKFSHWEHYTNYGTKDTNFNTQAQGDERSHFRSYIKKTKAENDYFKAVWVADTDTYPASQRYTATFLDTKGGTFRKVTVGAETVGANDKYGRFVLTIPNATLLYSGVKKTPVYGWTIKNDTSGRVYSAGQKVYLLKNTTFEPVTEASDLNTFTITLKNAKLWIRTDDTDVEKLRPAEFFGASVETTKSGSNTIYTYTNVQENYSLIAKPITEKSTYGWTEVDNGNLNKDHVVANTATVLSDNYKEYKFTAHENIEISYGALPTNSFYTAQKGVYVTTSPRHTSDAMNQPAVYFTSQFDLKEGYVFLAAGTMITKADPYYNSFTNKDTQMRLNPSTVTQTTINNRTYQTVESKAVKWVQATTTSSNYEYTAYIAHTKADPIQYYARAYVIYKESSSGAIKIAYSDVVAWSWGSLPEGASV